MQRWQKLHAVTFFATQFFGHTAFHEVIPPSTFMT